MSTGKLTKPAGTRRSRQSSRQSQPRMADKDGTTSEPFPSLSPSNTADERTIPTAAEIEADTGYHRGRRSSEISVEAVPGRGRAASITSSIKTATRTRGASIREAFQNSNPPLGMWQATGEVGSKLPTLGEIKDGAFTNDGWHHEGQEQRRGTNPHDIHKRRIARNSSASTRTRRSSVKSSTPAITEERNEFFPAQDTLAEETSQNTKSDVQGTAEVASSSSSRGDEKGIVGPDETGTYPNGYRFPKKHTTWQSIVIGSKGLWKFFLTPFGFLIVVYGLNVIGWGAMIFFVLLNAAPAMCHPSCSAVNSAREIWIEVDSQVLNGLFCVTGFGLIPWRFRDFYYLLKWRCGKGEQAMIYHRKLAGINRSWYRLPGSDKLADDIGPPPKYSKKNPQPVDVPPPYSEEEIAVMEANIRIPLPVTSMPDPPLTGVRAPTSRSWTIDVVVWMYLWNTIFQGALAGCMWGFNRHNRPAATTGIFITVGCLVAISAGITVFIEGSAVKKVEGVPVYEYDVFETMEEKHEREAKEAAKRAKHHKTHGTVEEAGVVEKEKHPRKTGTVKHKGQHWFTRH
jgi:hypothetical protein